LTGEYPVPPKGDRQGRGASKTANLNFFPGLFNSFSLLQRTCYHFLIHKFDLKKRDFLDDPERLFFENPDLFNNGLIAVKK